MALVTFWSLTVWLLVGKLTLSINFALGLPEKHLCKNRLQEYTQKAGLPLPTYRSKNEGFPHAPKFWAQVEVNGKTYASTGRFTHVKEAEQGAARTALEHITQIVKNAGIPTIQVVSDALLGLFIYFWLTKLSHIKRFFFFSFFFFFNIYHLLLYYCQIPVGLTRKVSWCKRF